MRAPRQDVCLPATKARAPQAARPHPDAGGLPDVPRPPPSSRSRNTRHVRPAPVPGRRLPHPGPRLWPISPLLLFGLRPAASAPGARAAHAPAAHAAAASLPAACSAPTAHGRAAVPWWAGHGSAPAGQPGRAAAPRGLRPVRLPPADAVHRRCTADDGPRSAAGSHAAHPAALPLRAAVATRAADPPPPTLGRALWRPPTAARAPPVPERLLSAAVARYRRAPASSYNRSDLFMFTTVPSQSRPLQTVSPSSDSTILVHGPSRTTRPGPTLLRGPRPGCAGGNGLRAVGFRGPRVPHVAHV
mmetsp:Transcript_1095/g.3020  ORF Transcript_1095/g.3020 Transcript_1095/m.3020 type:complete len:302 (-) Transcript_1095:125-1030(-)